MFQTHLAKNQKIKLTKKKNDYIIFNKQKTPNFLGIGIKLAFIKCFVIYYVSII